MTKPMSVFTAEDKPLLIQFVDEVHSHDDGYCKRVEHTITLHPGKSMAVEIRPGRTVEVSEMSCQCEDPLHPVDHGEDPLEAVLARVSNPTIQ